MNLLRQNKIKFFIGTLVLVLSFVVVPFFALAEFNKEINYQGKLTDSSGVAVTDGDYNMNFWILSSSTAATSTAIWSEARTGANKVTVTNGLFSVMLGDVSSLSGVDFNQTLYLGVEIGGTGTPAWDGEMFPRKVIGAVPAAFVAETANTFDGLATTSFLRADDADTMEATSSSALLTLIQNGAGKILSLFSGATEMFTVLNNGNVGIATTTPDSKLTVVGDSYLDGNLTLTGNAAIAGTLADSSSATGTSGQILSSTGTGTGWVSTSTLGLGNGTFLGLSDTISSYTANRLLFTNSGGTAVTDDGALTFDGTNFGLGTTTGIAWNGVRYLYASSTNDSVAFGEGAGQNFTNLTTFNTAIGYQAGQNASTPTSDYNNFIGYLAGQNNTGANNNFLGQGAGRDNAGDWNNFFGVDAGQNNTNDNNNFLGNSSGFDNTGSDNNIFGAAAGYSNTGSYNNLLGSGAGSGNVGSNNNMFGQRAGDNNTGDFNEMIGYQAGRYLQSTSSVLVGAQAFYGPGAVVFQAVNNTALGYRAGYNAATGASNNILLGYQAADNLTSGANNIVIGYDVDIASTTGSNQLNIGNLIFGTGIDGTGTTLSSGNIGIGTTTIGSKLTIDGDLSATGATSTFSGITLVDGCFQDVSGTCITASGDTQVVVAASNSLNKEYADYVADGVNDEAEINSAIQTVYNSGGGIVYLLEGDYIMSTSTGDKIVMASSTILQGAGEATLLYIASSTNTSVDVISITSVVDSSIRDLTIDGNEANQSGTASRNGIKSDYDTTNLVISGVNFKNLRSNAIELAYTPKDILITNNSISGYSTSTSIGINITGDSSPYYVDLNITNNKISNVEYAMSLGYVGNVVVDSNIIIESANGLYIGDSYDNVSINNNIIKDLADTFATGIQVYSTDGVSIKGNAFYNISYRSIDINDLSPTDTLVADNTFVRTTGGVGLRVNGLRTHLVGNVFSGFPIVDQVVDTGTNTRYNEWDRTTITTDDQRAYDLFTITGSSSAAIANLTQQGTGNLLVLNSSTTSNVLTVTNNGFLGLGTSTPSSQLTVAGDAFITGALRDTTNSAGTAGQILSSTGTGTGWVSTSTLGLGNGTFLGLSDTMSSYTANRLLFTNSGGTAVTDSANLTFSGTTLGLTGTTALLFGGDAQLSRGAANRLDLASGDSLNLVSGGIYFGGTQKFIVSGTFDNIRIGTNAGNTNGSNNNFLGYWAGFFNSGSNNNFLGQDTGISNTGSNNNLLGYQSGYNNTGSNNNLLGYQSGYNNTGSYNNFLGQRSGYQNTGNYNEMIGYQTGLYLQSTSSVLVGAESFYGPGSAFQAVNNTALGYRAGYNAVTGASNNILLGYQAADNLTTGANNIVLGYDVDIASTTGSNQLNIGNLIFGTGIDGTGTTLSSGNIGIGTSTPLARLAISKLNFASAGVAGLDQYFTFTNATPSTAQFATQLFIKASTTATTTIAGGFWKIEDNTTFGNTIRGFEVQTERGSNTLGENTAISGFARTFGLRGTTEGDAGGSFEPAGVFAETRGSEQGNAIRGYSSSITTTALLKLFQDTSTFAGTGLLMNFGNGGGSFSSSTSKFVDLQNAGSSMFTIGAYGMVTIGDGTTGQSAGLQIGYGGLCVDNDGTCSASVNGRIASVSTFTGNSDLAEMYFSNENLKAGEVVYLKGGLSVGKAGEETKDKVIGVVSTKPGLLLGYDDTSLKAGEKGYPLALSGRVPVRLSNENGEIKVGDELMLSSIPGVVMKATSTGKIVGVALEDFVENRAYSDTYINQFGDDIAMPVFEPISKDNDPRIHDGCYFGGGRASGDEPCVPLVSTTIDDQRKEAEILAKAEAEKRALARLKNVPSEVVKLSGGREVRVGQIVMFVDLRYRYVNEDGMALIKALSANASSTNAEEVNETVWQRLVNLANNFVDGVLSIFTLKADRVEVKNELCVDGVCIKADDLRQMLEKGNDVGGGNYQPPSGGINNNPPPSPEQNSDAGEEEESEEVEENKEEIDTEENLSDENTNELMEEEIDQTESDNTEEFINEESEEESEPQDPESDIPEFTETTPETSELINEDIIEETN